MNKCLFFQPKMLNKAVKKANTGYILAKYFSVSFQLSN